jgi:hypothetical protein
MREFVATHPHLTQFLVLLGIVILSIPAWALVGWGILEAARVMITDGCQARRYSCEYESATLVIALLVFMPFFFYFLIYTVKKVGELIIDPLLAWAGLDPKTALL